MTTIPFDVFQPRLVFLDDDEGFLGAVRAANVNTGAVLTADVDKTLDLVKKQEVDYLVSDMRLSGEDGVRVLREAHEENPAVGLALLTAYQPTPEQKEILKKIKAEVFYKGPDLLRLLTEIEAQALMRYVDERDTNAITQEVHALRRRLALLDELHGEWMTDLVEQLSAIPNQETATVVTEDGPTTILALVDDIKNLRPRGIRHIRLWLQAKKTVREARR
jgi:DNA-binding NtrC family response regulator